MDSLATRASGVPRTLLDLHALDASRFSASEERPSATKLFAERKPPCATQTWLDVFRMIFSRSTLATRCTSSCEAMPRKVCKVCKFGGGRNRCFSRAQNQIWF